jgi:ketosteroid isomerase-like protein
VSALDLTKEEVSRVHHEKFYAALKNSDFEKLAEVYADDYMLVRPDGSVLTKTQILDDLKTHSMSFSSIELTNETIRIYGSVGILTGDNKTVAVRDGKVSDARARIVAVYRKHDDRIEPVHFQGNSLPL